MNRTAAQGAPRLSVNDGVATITLGKPEHANRLSPEDLAALRRHVDLVNRDERILVLRIGSTGKYFCSGYDISSLADEHAPSSLYFGETMDIVEQARPVTIAMIQGGVYGGGTDLCLACDFRIGTTRANMFMPATRLGLHFYPGGLQRYVSRMGLDTAKRLFLTAETLDAEAMLRLGFLTELTVEDELEERVDELTNVLLAMAPIPLKGVKKHLNLIARGSFAREDIEDLVNASEASADIVEGALAWKQKRLPKFTGK